MWYGRESAFITFFLVHSAFTVTLIGGFILDPFSASFEAKLTFHVSWLIKVRRLPVCLTW